MRHAWMFPFSEINGVENMSCHTCLKHILIYFVFTLVANQVTESSDSGAAVESQHLKVEGLDTKPETNDFTEHPEPCEATETANEPAEDVEQSTGSFLMIIL